MRNNMERKMGTYFTTATASNVRTDRPSGQALHDLEQQCLRILRCTAVAFANSPGGLRFQAGTRPWLDALNERHAAVGRVG